jgi:hypothetical protein
MLCGCLVALRANFSSVDLSGLRTTLGSKSLAAEEEAIARLHARQAQRPDAEERVRRAIRETPPFWDVHVEDEAYVLAAVALVAGFEKKRFGWEVFDWHAAGFSTLHAAIGDRLSDRANDSLRFLARGRPLFGRRIKTAWSYYAYLERDEAFELMRELHSMEKPADVPHQYLDDLTRVLDLAVGEGTDVWMTAD